MRYSLILSGPGFLLLSLLLSMPSIAEGQKCYSDTLLLAGSSVFNETFDNNDNRWITTNNWLTGVVENGRYHIECKNYRSSTGLTYKTVNIDESRDYEIEATLEVLKGSGGLLFGMNSNFDHFRVEITDKNSVIIVKNIPSKNHNEILFSSDRTSLAGAGLPVKITVRNIDRQHHIFINENFVQSFTNLQPLGNQIGFNVGVNSKIAADNLQVFYIEKQSQPRLAENLVSGETVKTAIPFNEVIANKEVDLDQSVAPRSPTITWISPSSDTVSLDVYSARIRARVSSTQVLQSALVYQNGQSRGEGELKPDPNNEGAYLLEKTLMFSPGINSVYLVVTNSEGATMSELRHFTNPLAVLPVIQWGNPLNDMSIVGSDRVILEVCINSPSGLNSAKVIVNGEQRGEDKIFQTTEYGTCNIKWQKPVILREGDNSVYIIAANKAGSIISEQRIIRYQTALAEKRIALIVGNSQYTSGSSLRNPVNDANLMEATLKELGFDVIKRVDSGKEEMLNTIRDFSRKLTEYNVSLFYYAGHGLQVDGVNYLIPVDAKLESKEDCKWEAVAVNTVTDELKRNQANTNIVILDACRNNPYRSWARGEEAGFKALAPMLGTIISFATSEGATAADGAGSNGLFTEELVKQMMIPQQIESVFKNTRRLVMERSNNQQTPVEWSYLTGEFYFKK